MQVGVWGVGGICIQHIDTVESILQQNSEGISGGGGGLL